MAGPVLDAAFPGGRDSTGWRTLAKCPAADAALEAREMHDRRRFAGSYGPVRCRSHVPIAAVVLCAAVAACHSTPAAIPDPAGKASVRAYGGGTANFLAMTLKPIGESHDVRIVSVDREDSRHFGTRRQILLPPGHYAIEVACDFSIDFRPVSTSGWFFADVAADHTYLVDGALSIDDREACVGSIVDTTDRSP